MNNPVAKTEFIQPAEIEIESAETVQNWGRTLVVAPHPDDESLGCGGAIALLRKFHIPVYVLTLSDGTLSHPNSKAYPPEKLRELREKEMTSALEILGVPIDKVLFLRWRDLSVPGNLSPNFDPAVRQVKNILDKIRPQTILVPWRRDPHPDHRAAWQIVNEAIKELEDKIRLIEYPIWLWELAGTEDLPNLNEIKIWRLNIEKVIAQKQAAICAHRSQTTDLINDDPEGFRLSEEVLDYFKVPWEVYLEEKQ